MNPLASLSHEASATIVEPIPTAGWESTPSPAPTARSGLTSSPTSTSPTSSPTSASPTRTRRSSSTYSELTHRAAQCISRAHASVGVGAADPQPQAIELSAHRDLAAALVHLGRTLARPIAPPTSEQDRPSRARAATRRRGGPDARLLRSLAAEAAARDWTEPLPSGGPAADIAQAACLIRTAADLWATHHDSAGRPRSAEASRMSHPATLGAASREWRSLVALAAEAADAMSADVAPPDVAPPDAEPADAEPADAKCPPATLLASTPADGGAPGAAARRTFTRNSSTAGQPASDRGLLDLAVARPLVRRGGPPLEELSDRVDRLRHLAWTLAELGSAPATVHANFAAIGIALHRAALAAHEALAARAAEGPVRERHLAAMADAQAGAARWRAVSDQLRSLRTPHPSAHPIQVERLDIDRLLSRAAPSGVVRFRPDVAWSLSRMAESFADVAAHNVRAVRKAQERGDLLLLGRAIPSDILSRRPDLVGARLADQVIPAPMATVRRLEASYRTVSPGG